MVYTFYCKAHELEIKELTVNLNSIRMIVYYILHVLSFNIYPQVRQITKPSAEGITAKLIFNGVIRFYSLQCKKDFYKKSLFTNPVFTTKKGFFINIISAVKNKIMFFHRKLLLLLFLP